MPRGAQDLGNAIYAAHITWRQVGPLARYFNAYEAAGGVPLGSKDGGWVYNDRHLERKMEFRLKHEPEWCIGLSYRRYCQLAGSNWGFIDPTWVAQASGIAPANYPFLVRIWTGMVIMFGAMFWEISSDMDGKRHLIKYAWVEKSITALSVTIGYLSGRAPGEIIILIIFTDYVWIPVFLYLRLVSFGEGTTTT